MSKQISPYITFNGNCREAMNFYKECLGGELIFQTIGESPLAGKMPASMKDFILHATLSRGRLILMATDCVSEFGLVKGNSISLALNCRSEKEVTKCYQSLSVGGSLTHPLENTFWGALFGSLTDKYGNCWLLNFDKKK